METEQSRKPINKASPGRFSDLLAESKKAKAKKDIPGNGHGDVKELEVSTPIAKSPYLYREFIPRELPEDHKKLTPEWLYFGLDWRTQAQELQPQDIGNTREKIKTGMAVAVIIVGAVILMCVFAIGMGGK